MKKFWNRDDYQGRSEEQVERNYRIMAFVIMFCVIIGTWTLVITLISNLFK